MGAKSNLSVSGRREIVLLLLRREEPAGILARRHWISENTLYRWRDEFMTGGETAFPDKDVFSELNEVPEEYLCHWR